MAEPIQPSPGASGASSLPIKGGGRSTVQDFIVPSASIGQHELLRPIASGSYGEVWLARSAVGQRRAVKIVRRDRFERAEDFDREFKGLQNFEPVSRQYSGLMDILHIGRHDAEGWF